MRDLYDELGGHFNRAKGICDLFNTKLKCFMEWRENSAFVVLGDRDKCIIESSYGAVDYDICFGDLSRSINIFLKEKGIEPYFGD